MTIYYILLMKCTIEDEHLVYLIKQKNPEALHCLYDHYAGALYAVILNAVNRKELGDLILKRSFAMIIKNIDAYRPEKCRLFTFMLRTTNKEIINHLAPISEATHEKMFTYHNQVHL